MNKTFNFPQTEAMWVLKMISSEELPELARSALTEGFESEAIVQLAICSQDEVEQIQRIFQKILTENGGGSMSKIEALRCYAKQISSSILSNEISPFDGANLIWQATINAQDREFHELDSFIYAASEMEGRPEDKTFFEKAIREEAQRWI